MLPLHVSQELSLRKGEKQMAVYSDILPGFDNSVNLSRQVMIHSCL